MKISVILNSFHDFHSFGWNTLDSVLDSNRNYDFEVLVSTQRKISNSASTSRVHFFYLPGLTSVECLNFLSKKASGDIVSYLNDAVLVSNYYLRGLHEINEYFDSTPSSSMKVTSLPNINISSQVKVGRKTFSRGCALPLGASAPYDKVELRKFECLDGAVMRFPIVKMETLMNDLNGNIFNPYFKHHWVDNWLGIYCSLLGQPPFEYLSRGFCYKNSPFPKVRNISNDEFDYKILLGLLSEFNVSKPNYSHKPSFLNT